MAVQIVGSEVDMKIRKILFLILIIATVAACFVACNKDDSRSENVFIVGTTMEVDSLNRLDTLGGGAGYNFDKIASTVSQLAPVAQIDGSYVGSACDFDISEDGKTFTLTPKNLKWHDGTALSVDDIEYSLADVVGADDFSECKKEGGALVYTLEVSETQFLAKLAKETIKPKHIFQNATKQTLTDEQSVVGLGPYKYQGRDKSAGTITFVKNDDYPSAANIAINKVIFKHYGSADVMTLALKSGEIDAVYNYGKGLDADAAAALKSCDDVQLISYASKSIPKVLFFNNAKMTDARVKRAIAKSIDYAKIRSLFGSDGAAASREGFVADGIFGYKESAVWSEDLEQAKSLLQSAGYTESNKFRFELLVRTDKGNDSQYATVLKTQIERSGMVEVVLVEKGSDWQKYYQDGNHMASLATVTEKGYDFEAGYASRYTLATVTSMLTMNNPVSHGQLQVEVDGELTEYGKILKDMQGAKTAAELSQAVGKYQDYMVKNVPCVALFYDGTVQGASKKWQGFCVDGAYGIINPATFERLHKA